VNTPAGPAVPWRRWIGAGLFLDAALWAPFSQMTRTPFLFGLIMATLLCWSHVFLLPLIFLGRGLPRSTLVGGALKGAIFSPFLVSLGAFVSFISVCFGAALISWFLQPFRHPIPEWVNMIAIPYYLACMAMGGATAGACAGLVARDELIVPAPTFTRLALGAAMASIVMVPWPALSVAGSIGESFLLLLLASLPSLVLFRPNPRSAPTSETA
jgi:hypothetical protein